MLPVTEGVRNMPRPHKAHPDQWLLDVDPFDVDVMVQSDRGRPVLVDRYGNQLSFQQDISLSEDSP